MADDKSKRDEEDETESEENESEETEPEETESEETEPEETEPEETETESEESETESEESEEKAEAEPENAFDKARRELFPESSSAKDVSSKASDDSDAPSKNETSKKKKKKASIADDKNSEGSFGKAAKRSGKSKKGTSRKAAGQKKSSSKEKKTSKKTTKRSSRGRPREAAPDEPDEMFSRITLGVVVVLAIAGSAIAWVASDSGDEPTERVGSSDTDGEEAPSRERQPLSVDTPDDVSAPPASAQRTASGLASRVLFPGTGTRHPAASDRVRVHYSGWRAEDGENFDSSISRGDPSEFPLSGVIPGWTEGLQLMVEGEQRRFWIPGNLAYEGRRGPQGMLVFDVELIAIL